MNTITVFNILCAIVFASATIPPDESFPSGLIITAIPIQPEYADLEERSLEETAEDGNLEETAEERTMEEQPEDFGIIRPEDHINLSGPIGRTTLKPVKTTTTKKPVEDQTTRTPAEVTTTHKPVKTTTTKKPVEDQTTRTPAEVTTTQNPTEVTTTQKPSDDEKHATAGTIDYYRQEVNKLIHAIHKKLTKTEYTTSDLKILQDYEEINRKIQKAYDIYGTAPSYFSQFYTLPYYVLLDSEIAKVNRLYDNIKIFYQKNFPKITQEKSRDTWLALAISLNDPNIGLAKTIEGIQTYLNYQDESKYIYDLLQNEARLDVCSLKLSPYQILYNMYNIISLAELRAYAMLHFTYAVLTVFNAGNFREVADAAIVTYANYTKTHVIGLQNVLSKTDRSVYACDPKLFQEDVTYTRLIKVLQGYIENERNMHYRGSCIRQCHHFNHATFQNCTKGLCKHQPKCEGNILRCTLEKPDMTVCLSKDPARRYDWVDYKGGSVFGQKIACEKENLFKLRSWKRYVVECSYCLCLCDEETPKSDRYFNLRDVTSDVEKNMVVTGVKIIKRNRIIHLQIQQGVLLAGGKINQSSLEWKEVDVYNINDSNVTKGVDYHLINYKSRAVNLNELAGPTQHVVTGVRFQKTESNLGLGVRVTPVNFETGSISSQLQSVWLKNENPPKHAELKLNRPDIPVKFMQNKIYSTSNQYIRFQPTSFHKDLAQTTVPFLDTQEVITEGVALSGLGLTYRGQPGSGGFITPKILTYEFGVHLSYD